MPWPALPCQKTNYYFPEEFLCIHLESEQFVKLFSFDLKVTLLYYMAWLSSTLVQKQTNQQNRLIPT